MDTAIDGELESSKLGTIEYWNDAYSKEIENFKDHGDEGEIWFGLQSVRRIIKWIKNNKQINFKSKIIDIGCGNGYTCCELAKEGYEQILGIDYSTNAIELAKLIASREELNVTYRVLDILNDEVIKNTSQEKFDLSIDKGTYDAISLCPENPKEKRLKYKLYVKSIMHENSLFLVTSCNWTSLELKEFFQDEFVVFDEVSSSSQSNFSFAGKTGAKTSTVIFKLK